MSFRIFEGDCVDVIDHFRDGSVDVVFTSPNPTKSIDGIMFLVNFFSKFKRCLNEMGTVWINMSNHWMDNKGIFPSCETFVLAMRQEGWHLRNDLTWYRWPHDKSKMNPNDPFRFYRDTEHIYGFAHDSTHYFNDRLGGLHMTSVITCPTENIRKDEFKSGFPEKVVEICLKTTCKPAYTVLDPFCGTGTTGVVALKSGYHFIGIEKRTEKDYIKRIEQRLSRFGQIEDLQDPDSHCNSFVLKKEEEVNVHG